MCPVVILLVIMLLIVLLPASYLMGITRGVAAKKNNSP
ncbi:hypothetical protein PV-S19_0246 [Pacmanvirus S19]|nr:hypothetical protein PV-S19_0246 [Pacmanvirus S19]